MILSRPSIAQDTIQELVTTAFLVRALILIAFTFSLCYQLPTHL